MLRFEIELPPVTKKNSQRLVRAKNGRIIPLPSAAYERYEKSAILMLPKLEKPIDKAVNVEAIFYMATRRKVDLVNLQEALLDVLVKGGVLKDDCSTIVCSMDGSGVGYDKGYPRTEVWITEVGQ